MAVEIRRMTESRLHYAAATSKLAFFSLQLTAAGMEFRGAKRILNLRFACLTRSNLIHRLVARMEGIRTRIPRLSMYPLSHANFHRLGERAGILFLVKAA